MEQIQHGNITGCVERTAQKLDFKHFVLFKVKNGDCTYGLYLFVGVEALELSTVRRPRLCDCYRLIIL